MKKLIFTVFLAFETLFLLNIQCFAQLVDQGDIISSGNQTLGSAIFYEINGIVSMEAEHASYTNCWVPAGYAFDTKAMQADSTGSWKGGVLRFDIEFSHPGKYALWILARKGRRGPYNCNDVKVWLDRDLSKGIKPVFDRRAGISTGLTDSDGYQTSSDPSLNPRNRESELNIPEHYFTWSSNPKDGNGPAFWNVTAAGKHHIEFVIGEEWQYAIDKVILTLNNENPPQGRGPDETVSSTAQPLSSGPDERIILPPAWAFGILYGGYTNQQESIERVKSIIDHDYPIDAYWVDSWFWNYTNGGRGPEGFMNFTGDTIAYPNPGKMWSDFQKLNIKGGIWLWDIINKDGNEKVFQEFEKAGAFKEIFLNKSGWHNFGGKSLSGQINLTDSASVTYFQNRLKPLFDQGLDFLKLDRNPGVPFGKACFEAIQKYGKETAGRAFIMQHVGDLTNPDHKRYPTKWTGDSEIAWDLPEFPNAANSTMGGFTQNIEMVAWPKRFQYEVPFLTHDGGGFRIIGCPDYGEELFMRWIQFSLFNPITEVFQSLFNSSGNLAWQFSPRADSMYRKYAHLRLKLFPYIYSYAHLTRQTGQKMVQGDGVNKYQYLFGNEFLVGPVNEKGATTKQIVLPAGEWIDYYTGKRYAGGQTIVVPAPVDVLPLFVRAGAIIPMRDYSRSVELGSNHKITLDVYPYGSSSFTMYEDDGTSNEYLDGKYAATTFSCWEKPDSIRLSIGNIRGSYRGMLLSRQYEVKVHLNRAPESVIIDGRKMKKGQAGKTSGWYYNEFDKELHMLFESSTNKEVRIEMKL